MRYLGLKPGHDGAIALVEDGRLLFSVEGEKDSFNRNCDLTPSLLLTAGGMADQLPDVVALGGWLKARNLHDSKIGAGYDGVHEHLTTKGTFFGREVDVFTSSHERSHIYMAAGMAPWAPVKDGAVLVWEGITGSFYRWRDYGESLEEIPVLTAPGGRYSALFALADPSFPDRGKPRINDAGKLMALAAYDQDTPPTRGEVETVEALLSLESVYPFDKAAFAASPVYNSGVHTAPAHRAAHYLTGRVLDIFLGVARREFHPSLPLMISGGCGLNCDWNSHWARSGAFADVFVPPCANDSGSALGTVIDAMYQIEGPRPLRWSVYAGAAFEHDVVPDERVWQSAEASYPAVADRIAGGAVVAWVNGRCEMGPRALGNRSLLAAPFDGRTRERLNQIKGREGYRPIAPCCTVESLDRWFDSPVPDPYMLYFGLVRTGALAAVTHVDGSARAQAVSGESNPELHSLLTAFEELTGYAVLCNTSLNVRGAGFVNSMSDLVTFCAERGIDDFVVDGIWYRRRSGA